MAIPKPDPKDWIRANARELAATDREVLAMLRDAYKSVNEELARLVARDSGLIGDGVRRAQLEQSRSRLLAKQGEVFERLGDIVSARRARAAVRAQRLSAAADAALLNLVGKGKEAQYLYDAALKASQRAIDAALARMKLSALPLSQRIYRSSLWMDGRLGKLINETLAAGLDARAFAKKARDWFNPNTPGGIRFAAMRLARTEINNSFHAMSAQKYAQTPWITKVEWNLSGSHPKPDECNTLASASPYESDEVPARPHPQCMCYITPKSVDEDEFVENFLAGDYDEYLDAELEAKGWQVPDPAPAPVAKRPKPKPAPAPEPVAVKPTNEVPVTPSIQTALNSGIAEVKQVGGGMIAQTDLLITNSGKKLIRKKAPKFGGPFGDPVRQQDAEELASKLLRSLGVDAPEVVRTGPDEVVMDFRENVRVGVEVDKAERLTLRKRDDAWILALFDDVTMNSDRNPGNWLLGETVVPLDHANSWSGQFGAQTDAPSPDFETQYHVYWNSPFWLLTHDKADGSWKDNDISPEDVEAFRRKVLELRPEFERLRRTEWIDIAMRRLDLFAPYAKGKKARIK